MKELLKLPSTEGFIVTKAENEDEFFIEGYASKTNLDRDMEIIPSSAIDIENFQKNPIILYQHQRNEPCGKAVSIEKREDGLWLKVLISKTATKIKTLIDEGILRAFSVGFRIKKYDFNDAGILIYEDIELTETSLVSVPCNQNSLFSLCKSYNEENNLKENKIPNPIKKDMTMTDVEIKAMQDSISKMKAEKEALEKEKAATLLAVKDAKDLAERTAMADSVKTLKEALDLSVASIETLKTEMAEKEVKLAEELETMKKATPRVEGVAPAQKDLDTFMESFKDAEIESMLFKKELKDTRMFNSLPEQIKAVSLDTQFTTQVKNRMLQDIKNQAPISQLFVQIPSSITTDTYPFGNDMAVNWGTAASDQAFTPEKVTIAYYSIFSSTKYNYVTDDESIIDWLPFLRTKLVEAIGEGIDTAIVNRTTVTNAFPSLPVWCFAATGASTATCTYEVADQLDIVTADIDEGRAAMGKYGVKPTDLALIVNSAKYLQLLDDALVTTVDKFGPAATIITGQLGSIRGVPIFVNDSAPGSSAVGVTNAALTLVNRKMWGFKIKSQMVEFEKAITSQDQTIVSSARAGFGALTPLDSGRIDSTYAVCGFNPAS